MNFVDHQAEAWRQIIREMQEKPLFYAINGSANGPGASLEFTVRLRAGLPELLRRYNVLTMLDAPCGDLNWIERTDLSSLHSYIGMDVDPTLIESDRWRHQSNPKFVFICANLLTKKRFPKVDLIMCRHFLQHVRNEDIADVLAKFKASGSTYLLATNYPGASNEFSYSPNDDYPWEGYLEHTHDLTRPPYSLCRIDGIPEHSPPGGVLANEHELALFTL